MRKLVWLVVFFLTVSAPKLAEAYRWSQLGSAPLTSSIEDKISLQGNFSFWRGDVIEGLKLAEPNWDAVEVFNSLEKHVMSDRGVVETSFSPGQKFLWMIFKPRGRVGVVRDVEWTGNVKLDGYLISCIYRNLEVKFFTAKKCGNLALLGIRPLPLPPKAEVVPPLKVEAPPPCPPPQLCPQPLPCPPQEEVRVEVRPCPPSPPCPQQLPCPPPPCPSPQRVAWSAPSTDVCLNIEGIQTRVPDGLAPDGYGNCVALRQNDWEETPPPSSSQLSLGFSIGGLSVGWGDSGNYGYPNNYGYGGGRDYDPHGHGYGGHGQGYRRPSARPSVRTHGTGHGGGHSVSHGGGHGGHGGGHSVRPPTVRTR